MNQVIQTKHLYFFSLLDYNKDGYLDKGDFIKLSLNYCRTLGIQPQSRLYTSVQSTFLDNWELIKESSPNEFITPLEWLQFSINTLISDTKIYNQFICNQSKILMDLFDTNRDGKIQYDEYLDMLRCYGLSTQVALDSFKLFDTEHKRTIPKEKMMRLLRQFFTTTDASAPANHIFGIIPELYTTKSNALFQSLLH